MGPPPFSDGNAIQSSGLKPSLTSFNRATAFQRWKRHILQMPGQVLVVASMGPPPFSDGNGCRVRDNYHPGHPSMGPPPFSDGNDDGWILRSAIVWHLQWGHRLSAMETCRSRRVTSGYQLPSMGPPPFGDGNVLSPSLGVASIVSASMGPPPFGDGNFFQSYASSGWPLCFNGATAFRRWKPAHRRPVRPLPVRASMGPPPFGDGNGYVWVSSVVYQCKSAGFYRKQLVS